jgi:hypothetical protein
MFEAMVSARRTCFGKRSLLGFGSRASDGARYPCRNGDASMFVKRYLARQLFRLLEATPTVT